MGQHAARKLSHRGVTLLAVKRSGVALWARPSVALKAPTSMGSPNGVPVPCTATAATCHVSTSALASADRITACRHMVMVCQLCT